MCTLCHLKEQAHAARAASGLWSARRAFVLAAGASAASAALAQVEVGKLSTIRKLVPADQLEAAAAKQYAQMMAEAQSKRALVPQDHPQMLRLRAIANRIVPHAAPWNDRAKNWRWEINLISSKQINAFCMPGGKIAFYTGILDQLKLSDDEAAMIMGHEMAHALREHARERVAKSSATSMGLSIGAQLLGLGQLGDVAANLGTQLLTLKFSREDESESDLVGLDLAARAGYLPSASVTLWQKMSAASGNNGTSFLSTHPSGPERIATLRDNVPKVQRLYEAARKG
ncbi:MAG: M48 family metallopeptidase [Burkholderiaceae bacterium]